MCIYSRAQSVVTKSPKIMYIYIVQSVLKDNPKFIIAVQDCILERVIVINLFKKLSLGVFWCFLCREVT